MAKLVRICLLLLLLWATPGAGQEPTEPDPQDVLEHARQLYAREGPRAALPELEKALDLFRKAGDVRGEAITLGLIGNCHKRFGNYRRAIDYLQRALALKRTIGDRLEEGKSLSHIGLVDWEMGRYPQAIEHFEQSIAIAREEQDPRLEGSALNNLSLVYDEIGEYDRSLEQYGQVLELYRKVDFPRGESDTLGNLGGVHLLLGRYQEAQEHYERALAISERLGFKPSMSQDLGNLGWCHLGRGRLHEALASFERALGLAREAGLSKEEADWLRGRGAVQFQRGLYPEALDAYREALETYESAGLKRELVEALHQLGDLFLLLGDAASGEESFRRGLTLARQIDHPRGATQHLVSLGDLEWRRRRFEEAAAIFETVARRGLESSDRAVYAQARLKLALVCLDQRRLDEAQAAAREACTAADEIEAMPLQAGCRFAAAEVRRRQGAVDAALNLYSDAERRALAVDDPELLWRVRYGRGQVLELARRYDEALQAYQAAVVTIEAVRSRLREERFQAGYLEDKFDVYVALVRLQLRLGRSTEAFVSSERLRARSYLRLLHGVPAPAATREPSRQEAELRGRIRQLERALQQEWGRGAAQRRPPAIHAFSRELAAAERAYQSLLDDRRRTHPDWAAPRELVTPSVEDVRRALPPRTALLEYLVAEDGIVIFLLTREGLRATSMKAARRHLDAKVAILRDRLARRGGTDWQRPAASLAALLIEPVEQPGWLAEIEQLYIVAHGVLHYLPFAVLPRHRGGETRFLIEDYVLASLPSAAAWVGRHHQTASPRTLLALAPQRPRLRHAVEEVQGITRYFPLGHAKLLGAEATESAFRERASAYPIVHLATHGYFNRENPLLSGLQLEPDAGNDGLLEVHEILDLRLAADLVTLSACETGLGAGHLTEIPAGDDFVGLTRAFLAAGSASVLASLWPVDDHASVGLMQRFYGQLGRRGKAAALAHAQRESIRAQGDHSHPFYWAPFVLVGEMGGAEIRKAGVPVREGEVKDQSEGREDWGAS